MYFYKLVVAYDGTSYFGWQWQPHVPTIEAVFKNIITGLFKQKKFYFLASSRTDSGVHAHGQVARLGMALQFEPSKLLYIFNQVLPVGITVRAVESVDGNFNPQKNVQHKIYTYSLFEKRPLPEYERYAWAVNASIDEERLQTILDAFIGTHDFRLYAKEPGEKKTIRSIDSITVVRDQTTGKISITVQGKSFLHLMIRRIVGAAVALCLDTSRDYKHVVQATLVQGVQDFNLMKNLPTAPPHGLCLELIMYSLKVTHEQCS